MGPRDRAGEVRGQGPQLPSGTGPCGRPPPLHPACLREAEDTHEQRPGSVAIPWRGWGPGRGCRPPHLPARIPDKSLCSLKVRAAERRGPCSADSAHKGTPHRPARDPRGRHAWLGRACVPDYKGQRPSQALALERRADPHLRQPASPSRGLHLKDQSRHHLTGLVATLCVVPAQETLLNKQLEPLPHCHLPVPLSRPAALLCPPSVLQIQIVPGPDRSS